MTLAITTLGTIQSGAKQYAFIPPSITAYQQNGDAIDTKTYFSTTNPLSPEPVVSVGTATLSIKTVNKPKSTNLFDVLYSPENTEADRPLIFGSPAYVGALTGAANSGYKKSVNWNITSKNYVVVVVKSAQASTAGKLKLRSSVGNEYVCAFTTSATAETWTRHIFAFKDTSFTGVTLVGTPTNTITETEVTADLTAKNIDTAWVYCTNDISEIIGNTVQIVWNCVTEGSMTDTLNQTEVLCGQLAEAQIANSREVTGTLSTRSLNISDKALAIGATVNQKEVSVSSLYNNDNVGARAITAGSITVASGLNINHIYIEGVGYLKSYPDAVNVPVGAYNYTGTTIKFNTAYNGKIPTIYVWDKQTLDGYTASGLQAGIVGYLELPMRTENGTIKYILARKVQVSLGDKSADDGGDTQAYNLKFFKSGSDQRFYDERQS